MNKMNLAGILRTYAEQVMLARDDNHIEKIICKLKADLKDEMEANQDERA